MAKVISQLPSGGSVPKHNNLLGLNEGDYLHLTQFEKAKLDGIQSGAEVNVNADWNAISGDAQILNKPTTFPPSAHTHTKSQITDFAHTHPISDVTGLPTALDDLQLNKEDKANKNIANGYAGLDSSGKINPIQLPALAITDTFVVASQAEQLALVAEVGDVAVRTDLNKSFILRVTGASTLANWQELLSPTSVDQTIIDGSTNAVSGNAVFDGLATKAPISSIHNPVTLGTANGLSLSTQQLSLGLASSGVTGALSGADWNTFNAKFNTPTGLTTNYLPKWNGSGFGNSQIFDNGSNVGIGAISPFGRLNVSKASQIINSTNASGALVISDDINTVRALELGVDISASISYIQARSLTSTDVFDLALNPNGGNVGIGTNTPSDKLSVAGTISALPATLPNQVVVKSQLDAVAARPYKVYTALLSQTGTNAPTATVLENTLGTTITWTRAAVGVYVATLGIGTFTAGKVFRSISNEFSDGANNIAALSPTAIQVNTKLYSGSFSDGKMLETAVEIRIYP